MNKTGIKWRHKGLVFRPCRWLTFIILAFMACCIGYSCSGSGKDEGVMAPEFRMPRIMWIIRFEPFASP